ncbi:MAG: sensor histidine kinase [Anaerovoracaceae bacterium]|jgi:signal transduction histidine kinase
MKGIRRRLTASFLILILISVVILEILLIYTVKQNYYGSLEGNLTNQVKISADMYSKYYSDSSLEDNILYNVDAFWNQSNSQVEIVDREGHIIMNSQGTIPISQIPTPDIEAALNDRLGQWVGTLEEERVMAVSYPLKSRGEIVGALRLIASTKAIDEDIVDTAKIFTLIGVFVVLIVGFLSIFLANTILVPLKEVTSVAESMAAGNFKVRSKKRQDDEIGKLSDTLNYMADEIEKKEKLKNDFISSISHELRTPLTSIMGWAITLQNENLQEKAIYKDGLSIIEKESGRLTQMVEELLDFSKFNSDRIRLEYEKVDLCELLQHIYKQMLPRAKRRSIEFILTCPEDLPWISTDPNRMKQLFINILDNAFNFTEDGGEIDFQVQANENELVFIIKDNGCGIGAEELPMVKEKFFKGKSSRSRNGIGLSICEEIVHLMQGQLDIISELNVGTTVIVTIPRKVVCND